MKQKTKKGAKKRFSVTGTGKILRRKGYSSHLKQKKSSSRLRRQAEPTQVSSGDETKLKRMLGV